MNAIVQTRQLKNRPPKEAETLADVFSPACEGILVRRGLSA